MLKQALGSESEHAEVGPASKLYLEWEQVAHPFPPGNTLRTSWQRFSEIHRAQ